MRKGPSAEATPPTDVVPDAGVVTVIPSTSDTKVVSTPAASARPPVSAAPPLVLAAADAADSVGEEKVRTRCVIPRRGVYAPTAVSMGVRAVVAFSTAVSMAVSTLDS